MLGYLAGALLTSVTLGLVIVFALQDSTAVDTTKRTVNPVLDIAAGAILLVAWIMIRTGRHLRRKPKEPKQTRGRRAGSRRCPRAHRRSPSSSVPC
jgi:hypothetical protein